MHFTAFGGIFSPRGSDESPIKIASFSSGARSDDGSDAKDTPAHIAFDIPFLDRLGLPQPIGKYPQRPIPYILTPNTLTS